MDNDNTNSPLLSICIPTYNRAEYLEKTLTTITSQSVFQQTNLVEIVVSDNSSSDNTPEIAEKFVSTFPNKIIYSRNPTNIVDGNFEKALSLAKGVFLKLNNDTLTHKKDSLEHMLKIIALNRSSKNLIFFSNSSLKKDTQIRCKNADAFVSNASYWMTFIGAFGIWKKDFERLKDFSRKAALHLVQVDVILRLLEEGREAIIDDRGLFETLGVRTKGGYDLLKVFVTNYLFLLSGYKGSISPSTIRREENKLLLKYVSGWICRIKLMPATYHFVIENWRSRIIELFKHRPILLFLFFIKLPVHFVYLKLRMIFQKDFL